MIIISAFAKELIASARAIFNPCRYLLPSPEKIAAAYGHFPRDMLYCYHGGWFRAARLPAHIKIEKRML